MKPTADMNLKRELSKRLEMIRAYAGLSQLEFAESIGVSRVHYNRMESPDVKMMPSQPLLKHLCEVHNINFNWLMTGDGEMYVKQSKTEPESQKNAIEINEPMVNQTIEYVSLKSTEILKKESMDERAFLQYLQFFASVINLVFRLMKDVRNSYAIQQPCPDKITDSYILEFRNLLKNSYMKGFWGEKKKLISNCKFRKIKCLC